MQKFIRGQWVEVKEEQDGPGVPVLFDRPVRKTGLKFRNIKVYADKALTQGIDGGSRGGFIHPDDLAEAMLSPYWAMR